jgi:hypothetical protein
MSPAEARFREVEVLLNKKLGEYRDGVASNDVALRDASVPTYHYKSQFLSWSWTFVRDAVVEGETRRVSVSIDYGQPIEGKDKIDIGIRAEVFQQGQVSRIDRRETRSVSVEQIQPIPFATLIEGELKRGQTLLEARF